MRTLAALVATSLLLVVPTAPSLASAARSWSISTAAGFAGGTLDGTSLDEEGRIRLAPEVETLWGPDEGIVWAVAAAPGGGAFVALSGPGRAMRVNADGIPEMWYQASEEGLITAIVGDDAGGVYLGLSPEGEILHLSDAGRIESRLGTEATFVWAVTRGARGDVWAATGVPGMLLREADGEMKMVFDSGDDPVRCVAAQPGGGVVVGTGGRGRVIRVNDDESAFVLFDAEEPEVVAVTVTDDGTVYALATQGAKQVGKTDRAARASADATVRVVASAPPREDDNRERRADDPQSQQKQLTAPAGGALYRIDSRGGARRIWHTTNEMPFALGELPDGRLIVTTGDEGRVYAIDAEGRSARLLRIGSNQASALALGDDGRVLIGGTTDARLVAIEAGGRSAGSYRGPVVDAGTFASWGRVRWEARLPRGTDVEVRARVGNTQEPDDTWSEWVRLDPAAADRGAETGLPAARWFQVEVEMSGGQEATPVLSRIEAFFQARNRPPVITQLQVEDPGVVWVRGPTQSANRVGPVISDDPVARRTAQSLNGGRGGKRRPPIRRSYEAGARTFHWTAEDPDRDRLRYSLHIRREGDSHWFPLFKNRSDEFYSRDVRDMPDGLYRVRLTCDDALDNPRDVSLSDDEVSDAFHIDNTRPTIQRFEVQQTVADFEVEFLATDPGGSVASVEIALDGGDWSPLSPLDGVADSAEERYQVSVERDEDDDEEGRSIRVRVTDSSGNLGGDMRQID